MTCPEQNKNGEAQDKAYCDYLSGHSNGPAGFLMLLVGLEKIYEAMDKEEEDEPIRIQHEGASARVGETGKSERKTSALQR